MSEEKRSGTGAAPEGELTPKPNDRAGLYLMVGFAMLMVLVVVFGWLTNPP